MSEQNKNNSGKSEGGSSSSGNRNRNRNRRRSNSNRKGKPSQPKKTNTNQQNPKGKPQGNKKRRRRRKRPSENLDPIEKIFRKYENLLDQHLIARKKYYEFFHRADPKQKVKLEYNFTRTIKEVRDFESSLQGEELEKFNAKYHGLKLDTTYTSNRDMKIEGDAVSFEGEFEDPHYLPSQIDSDYSDDTEESTGTMDDYNNYKGLS